MTASSGTEGSCPPQQGDNSVVRVLEIVNTRGLHARASAKFVQTVEQRQGFMIACPEEVAFRQEWIDAEAIRKAGTELRNSGYGRYLLNLAAQS